MSMLHFFKEQADKDPVIGFIKRLRGGRRLTPQSTAYWHFKQARSYVNYKSSKFDLRAALFHLKEAIRIVPNNAVYHLEFGRILLMAPTFTVICGDDGGLSLSRCAELSIESIKRSLDIDPNLGWSYYHLALAYEYMGKREKAMEVCSTAVKKLGKSEEKSLLENYLERLKSPPLEKSIRQQLEQESFNHLEQARIYQRSGKKKQAIKEFEEGCRVAPDSAWLYSTLRKLSSK